MNSGTLKEVLKVNFLSLTKEEIENIMDEELEKAPEEMDTELIDMCLDILTGEPEKKADEGLTDSSAVSEKKVRKFNFKKGILVAAIITLLISIAIPAGAKIFDIDVPENILKVYEDFFHLNAEGRKQGEDLSSVLAENGLDDVLLPRYLYTDCWITDFKKSGKDMTTKNSFDFVKKKEGILGNVTWEYMEFSDGELLVNVQYEGAKQLIVNGIKVFVFNEGAESLIVYFADGMEYNIVFKGVTFEKAIEIASTL